MLRIFNNINVDAIGTAMSKKFAQREKAKTARQTTAKPQEKVTKKTPAE
jgi:hypothetical protein